MMNTINIEQKDIQTIIDGLIKNDEMKKEVLANFNRNVPVNEVSIESGIVKSSKDIILILTSRSLLNKVSIELIKDHVMKHIFLLRIRNFIIKLENRSNTIPAKTLTQNIVELGKWVMLNPGKALTDVENYVKDLLDEFQNPGAFSVKQKEHLKKIAGEDIDVIDYNTGNIANDVDRFERVWKSKNIEAAKIALSKRNAKVYDDKNMRFILRRVESQLQNYPFHEKDLVEIQEHVNNVIDVIDIPLAVTTVKKSKGRKLTQKEIEALSNISFANAIEGITDIIEQKIKDKLIKQLKNVVIRPELIQPLSEKISESFAKARVKPGHWVGLIAAQAIGHEATQASLSSFHHAGVSGDTGGSRIVELADNSSASLPKNPVITIFLKGNPSFLKVREYASLLETTSISSLGELLVGHSSENSIDPNDQFEPKAVFPETEWHKLFEMTHIRSNNSSRNFPRPPLILRLIVNKDRLYQRRIAMHQIAHTIESIYFRR